MLTMKAIEIEKFGGPETMHLDEIPMPIPREREVLLKIRAAGVNPVDYKIRSGKYPAVKEDALPYVLGRDVAGGVAAVGVDTTKFAVGDALYGAPRIGQGGYAEYVLLREDEAAKIPASLDYISAAAVPLAALTAWQGLFRYGELKAGQSVLIHGGSGGVGHFAIQFAKVKGARVATTVSAEHADFVRKLGADQVIDYKRQRFEDEAKDVDMIFDLVGGETQERSFKVLKKGGILVSTLTAPSEEKARASGVRATRYTVRANGAELAEIATLIDAGRVKPVVTKVFPLGDAAAALGEVEKGHSEGKIVLTVP
jgi:NADPH:quinone reductase-like Zn-dependent oxidoreductase